MIPLKLKLHNFTAYGPNSPELDFEPLKLVVLSGSNGAGKSSVLDSITWCIWGWSRAGDNADRLVRLGESQMSVEFSFLLEGTEYTITRTRKIGGTGSSTLQFFAGTDKKNNLTEGTIKATQEKIINTLHLTYETFINSSYLRQNHADEFTIKGPTDRKKILADILGLDMYDLLEERAKLKAKEAQDSMALLEIQISELEAELTSTSEHREVQSTTEAQLKKIQAQLSEAEKTLTEVMSRKEKQLASVEVERAKKERVAKIQSEIAELELEQSKKREHLIHFKELLGKKDAIENDYRKLLRAREELRSLEELRSKLISLKDEALAIEQSINRQKIQNERSLQQIKSRADLIKENVQSLEKDLSKIQADEATCPTCGQKLGQDEHAKIEADLKKKISECQVELEKLRSEYKQASVAKIEGEDELKIKQEEIGSLEEKSKTLSEVRSQVDKLEESEKLKRDLEVAAAQEKSIKEEGLRDKGRIEKLQKELEVEGRVDLDKLEDLLITLDQEVKASDTALRQLRQEESVMRERLAEAKQLVTRATQMAETLAKKKKNKSTAAEIRADYDELSQAFGKRGIQAMLIESAIPEIETEANELLNKLTDGRMQVQMLTQRENKTGGIAETLDIIISDELGARSYEMYSGGEAFRINLAIRLALSRLLTHRAGAKLQFLIIDEGFGTQDTQGKDKVVQAINLISEEFEKILVVTHDPDLKDAFPQRVEVVRNATGSSFEVLA